MIARLFGRLVLPRGWTREWNGPVPILLAYFDLMLREHYIAPLRVALYEENPLFRMLRP